MKREKRLTKKERKAQNPQATQQQGDHHHHHIHCTACGKHLDEEDFDGTAEWVSCAHGSTFASCTEHLAQTQALLAEHDRTGQPVRAANAWH